MASKGTNPAALVAAVFGAIMDKENPALALMKKVANVEVAGHEVQITFEDGDYLKIRAWWPTTDYNPLQSQTYDGAKCPKCKHTVRIVDELDTSGPLTGFQTVKCPNPECNAYYSEAWELVALEETDEETQHILNVYSTAEAPESAIYLITDE